MSPSRFQDGRENPDEFGAVLLWFLRGKRDLNIYPNYEDLVETCFNLIIGVELIRMLYQHKPSTVFEVLLFAIARQVIMAHNNPVSSLIGVISIALLFATRKFLFIEFDESEKIIFRATTKARIVNSILHVHIPYEDEQTLYDVITKRFEQEKTNWCWCKYILRQFWSARCQNA